MLRATVEALLGIGPPKSDRRLTRICKAKVDNRKPMPYIPLMIDSFRDKALKRLWTKGDVSGIRPDWRRRVERILNSLDAAEAPEELDLPSYGFHALTGNMAGRYAVTVSHNWRITFGWSGQSAIEIDLEDYHG
jgi:proteic killer suppression protein